MDQRGGPTQARLWHATSMPQQSAIPDHYGHHVRNLKGIPTTGVLLQRDVSRAAMKCGNPSALVATTQGLQFSILFSGGERHGHYCRSELHVDGLAFGLTGPLEIGTLGRSAVSKGCRRPSCAIRPKWRTLPPATGRYAGYSRSMVV